MPDNPDINYCAGFAPSQQPRAAALYEEAFGAKFSAAIRSQPDRMAILADSLSSDYALSASVAGELVGLAGFQTADGSFTGGIGVGKLFRRLGLLKGLRALAIFSLYERKPAPGELLMDGICVDADFRGHGIGGQLLAMVEAGARDKGYRCVRLDVIDINPGARRLYERQGFVASRTEHFPVLRGLLGFSASTTMILQLDQPAAPA